MLEDLFKQADQILNPPPAWEDESGWEQAPIPSDAHIGKWEYAKHPLAMPKEMICCTHCNCLALPRNGDLDLQMYWILMAAPTDTGEEVLEHLRRRFPGEMFFTSESTPGTVYIVHVTEKANQEVINETYRIADLIYERNEKEKETLRLLPAVATVDRPLLRLWEPDKKHESQAEVSECIDPLS